MEQRDVVLTPTFRELGGRIVPLAADHEVVLEAHLEAEGAHLERLRGQSGLVSALPSAVKMVPNLASKALDMRLVSTSVGNRTT